LLAELREAGFEVRSIWDWVNIPSASYLEAEPILLWHLEHAQNEQLIAGIARSLTDRVFEKSRPVLLRRFRNVQKDSTRWAIGNAIATVGFKGIEQQILELVADQEFGKARQMLVSHLYRIQRLETEQILVKLLGDPTVDGWAASALSRCGGRDALRSLEEADMSNSSPYGTRAIPKAAAKLRARLGAT